MKRANLSEEITEAFTCGDCWLLADALHRITGFPHAFIVPDDEWEPIIEDCGWVHVGVLTPDGKFLDVMGLASPTEAAQEWEHVGGSACIIVVSPIEYEKMVADQLPYYGEDPETAAHDLIAWLDTI